MAVTFLTNEDKVEFEKKLSDKVDSDQGTKNAGKILGIGEDGMVVPVDAPSGGSGNGLNAEQIAALDGMFKIASYTKDPTSAYSAFRTAFGLDHTHEYTSVVTTTATCATAGVRTYTCACGESYTEEIPATGHSWDAGVVTVEPTENTEGVRTYTCTVCGETKTETIPVLGHEHSYVSTVLAPTCTEQGYTEHICACGDTYRDAYVDATGHTYVDGVCTVCGAVDPDYKPPVTLTGISATYSGGDVPVGTAVSELTGIVVTATYSDGSTKRVTGYTLSGEIGEGSNTITVTYEGMTTTIVVNGYDASKIVTIVNGFLVNTTTATSAPAANSSFPYAWAMSNAIPVNAGDTITAVVEPSNANAIGNVRIRVYNADGSYKESSTSQNGKVYNVHTSTVDGYVRIANTNAETCELVSVVVENSEGSTTYSVVDQR